MDNPIQELYGKTELPKLEKKKTALLCIDIQYHDASPGFGFFSNTKEDDPRYKYYFQRLKNKVFPNVNKLQELFRNKGMEVIHARIESLTQDGRDRSLEHKRIGCHVPKGSKAADFIPEVAPKGDEIILSKTGSGVFNCTNLDYVLKNLGIDKLVTVGVLTNECIETATRDGADKSYTMYLVEDCMAAFTEDLHKSTLRVLNGVYGFVTDTETIEKLVESIN